MLVQGTNIHVGQKKKQGKIKIVVYHISGLHVLEEECKGVWSTFTSPGAQAHHLRQEGSLISN